MTTIAEAAVTYDKRGWKPVPVSRKTKKAIGKGWQKRPYDSAQFNGNAQNVGVQFGEVSNGLTDVDLDTTTAIGLAPEFLPPTDAIFGRRSKPASHQLYVSELWKTEPRAVIQFREYVGGKPGPMLVELRIGGNGKGAISAFPPSMHATGEMVEWVRNGEPANADGDALKLAVTKLAIATLLLPRYPGSGSRHEAALVLGGVLARAGWSAENIEHVVGGLARAAGDDDVSDRVTAAVGALELKANGGNVPGWPRFKEMWGDDAATTLGKWLGYAGASPPPKDSTDEDKIALEFSALHANDMRYVAAWGRWYKWDGACWRHETTLQAFDEARALVRAAPIKKEAKIVSAVVTFARADRRQAATADQWDTDPWLLGTPGGTVELRTGKLRAARPLDYITKQTAVAPKRMPTPLWTAYLEKVTAGDKDLQAFLQRWAGYSLTGSTVEHALVFLYGRGKNGKSTFLEAISRILGDYHQKADMELLNASKFARHSTEVAVLRGARMVTAIETGEEKSWDEAKIKALTGGDTLSARFMRQDPFSFVPQFKLTIGGNHKPVIRTVDEAIRRRFIMAPFTVTIPEEERDKDLGDKLKAEWAGILAWMIDGYLEWQRVGLAKPKAVLDTTATYLEAQDVLQDFIDTCCAVAKTESDTFEGIWDGWTDYCDDCREPSGTRKAFGQRLQDKGFMPVKGGKGVRRYQGLRCMRENMKKLLAQAALKRKGKT